MHSPGTSSPGTCIRCKGRLFCGRQMCAVLERFARHSAAAAKIPAHGAEFTGSSPPGVFVSWRNYPCVSFAPVAPPEVLAEDDAALLDAPERWLGLPEEKITAMRETLISARTRVAAQHAADPSYKIVEMQESAMASKPVVVDIALEKKPEPRLSFDSLNAPMGPSAPLKAFALSENPKIPKKVDYLVADTDARANTAIAELYAGGLTTTYLHKILSAGLLGVKRQRKFVPTRWAITAVDSNISEILMGSIRTLPQISEVMLFHSSALNNHYWALLFPAEWQFEQLEAWQPGSGWALHESQPTILSDHEFYPGRKGYADEVTGAYYSARLAVAEYLAREKRQAGCIIFREISPKYNIPLGVWQIRENVRNALQKKPLKFSTLQTALSYLDKKLAIPVKYYKKKSALLDAAMHQRKLAEWL